MTYDMSAEIAELRAKLAHCFLTTRERTGALQPIAALIAPAKEAFSLLSMSALIEIICTLAVLLQEQPAPPAGSVWLINETLQIINFNLLKLAWFKHRHRT